LALDPRLSDYPLLAPVAAANVVSRLSTVITSGKVVIAVILDRKFFVVEQCDVPFLTGAIHIDSGDDIGFVICIRKDCEILESDVGDGVSVSLNICTS